MTAFTLKIIASLCMLIDHVGAVFDAPHFFRMIGRIAFPLYAYLIAQGCVRTKNIYKYLLRLGLFAVISEIPFDLTFSPYFGRPFAVDYLRDTNVFFTLFLGAASVAVYEKLKPKLGVLALLPAASLCLLGNILDTDYGMYGVLFILFFYGMKPDNRLTRTAAMAAVVFIQYGYPYIFTVFFRNGVELFRLPGQPVIFSQHVGHYFLFALAAVPLVLIYNGKRGPNPGWLKWAFYAYYPVHLAALGLIWYSHFR